METVFADEFCNTDDLLQLIEESSLNEQQQWYENDLQLAAELGKTLLERNKELEFTLRQQQAVVEDQALEIEYLSKQTTALREVGESRLKIYEQLEINLAEVEKSHQKLQQESTSDKKRIKTLSSSLADVEQRCEQLQRLNEELNDTKWRDKMSGRMKSDTILEETEDYVKTVDNLRREVDELRGQMKKDDQFKDELETEMNSLLQENEQLREQLVTLKQRENVLSSLPLELKELQDEFKHLSRVCQRCSLRSGRRPSEIFGAGVTELEEVDEEEEEETSQQIGKCAVVKLNNGGTAYGNGERLQYAGRAVSDDEAEKCKWSLLTELDTQYRILIEKYERMVNARQQAEVGSLEKPSDETQCPSPSCSEDYGGVRGSAWPHATEESSSLSSGFSESDEGPVHKSVQTDPPNTDPAVASQRTVASKMRSKQSFDSYFQRVPEYKTIFQEIFAVLKKSISYDETAFVDSFPVLTSSVSTGTLCEQSFGRKSYADVLVTGRRRRKMIGAPRDMAK